MQRLITASRVRCGPAEQCFDNAAVLIDEGTIRAVGPVETVRVQTDPDTIQQHFPQATIVPGLINAHVHLCFDTTASDVVDALRTTSDTALSEAIAVHARELLARGYTTVRDLGDRNGLVLHTREELSRKHTPAPRIVAAGAPLTSPGGHCWFLGGEVADRDAIRNHIRQTAAAGADLIKVMASGGFITRGSPSWQSQFELDELRLIVDEATRAGLPVAAHAHSTAAIDAAVQAGVSTVEHCTWMSHQGQGGLDDRPDIATRMAAEGTWVCPAWPSDWPALLDGLGAELADRAVKQLSRTAELGVRFLFGTDAGVARAPFDAEPAEALSLYEHLGFHRTDILDMVTVHTAAALGIDNHVGRLVPGHAADLLVLDGDPIDDLDALRNRRLVLASGHEVPTGVS